MDCESLAKAAALRTALFVLSLCCAVTHTATFSAAAAAGSTPAPVATPAPTPKPSLWENVYAKNVTGVVYILSEGLCSGVFVAPDLVLTAAHCVAGTRTVRVGWAKEIRKRGEYEFEDGVRVVAIRREDDLAVLRVPTKHPEKVLPVAPESHTFRAGQRIATIGHPSALNAFSSTGLMESQLFLMTEGIVAKPGNSLVVSDLLVLPGNSGGAVFDEEGRVVGVVSGDLAYFTPASRVQSILESARNSIADVRTRPFVGTGAVAITLFADADRLLVRLYDGHQNIAVLAPSVTFFELVRARYSVRIGPQDARKRMWDGSLVGRFELSRLVDAEVGLGAGHVIYEDESSGRHFESPVVVFHAGILGLEAGVTFPTRQFGRPSFTVGADLLQLF